jgi:rhodanese-related sulfurtransferase
VVRPEPSSGAAETAEISRGEILRRLDDPALHLVDVLPAASYAEAHIPGALSLPVAEIPTRARALLPDRAAEIAVYCGAFT